MLHAEAKSDKRCSIEFYFFVQTSQVGHFESGFKKTMLMHALGVALRLFEHMFSISLVYMVVGLCDKINVDRRLAVKNLCFVFRGQTQDTDTSNLV